MTDASMQQRGTFQQGDRVRVKNSLSEYTGCRGTVEINAADQPAGVSAMGFFVAIDGENGRTRPFLAADLERLEVARVRPSGSVSTPDAEASADRRKERPSEA